MLNNLKFRISLSYSLLLILILASALFVSYQIIGLQLKNEIVADLKNKSGNVLSILQQEDISEEKSKNKHHDEQEEEQSEKSHRYGFWDVQLFTEGSDNNTVLFLFADGELKYITEKYKTDNLKVKPFEIPDGEVRDVIINDTPFSITALNMPEFTLYIGYKTTALFDLQHKLLNIFLIVFPIGVILSFLFGFLVTQKSMNIVKRISKTAESITSTNLENRIAIPKGNDEISSLIITLNLMIDRLDKSFVQAKQFSQDAAHEIRTPLTIIRGEIEELLENSETNETTIKTLENVLEEIQYLTSISERLLLIHKMDTNNIKYHFEPIDLSSLLVEISQDAEIISSEKNIEIQLDNKEGITINGNKELITRLLWNITDNAIKYNKPVGKILFSLSNDEKSVFVKIKDTGIGIPKEEIPKIFDRFYRVDKSRSRRLGGSGLGLAICNWIVELHNGEIVVNSEVNIGTEFCITLSNNQLNNL